MTLQDGRCAFPGTLKNKEFWKRCAFPGDPQRKVCFSRKFHVQRRLQVGTSYAAGVLERFFPRDDRHYERSLGSSEKHSFGEDPGSGRKEVCVYRRRLLREGVLSFIDFTHLS